MRLRAFLPGNLALALLMAAAPSAKAEYIVLRSGARLSVTGYELRGDTYHLQISGGSVELPVGEVVSIEPEEVFEPLPAPLSATTPFQKLIRAAAERYSVDADLIHCVIAVESNFNPNAISPKNARGLMQLLPQTAAHLGIRNIFDPAENIDGGTRYLRDLLGKYSNNLNLALAAYNAGPNKVERFGHRVPPYAETRNYVLSINRAYTKFKADRAAQITQSAAVLSSVPSPR
jgi:soluble lytic murein transglycosylase-like protein